MTQNKSIIDREVCQVIRVVKNACISFIDTLIIHFVILCTFESFI